MFRLIPMAIVVSKLLKTMSEPVQEAVEKTTANVENENAEKVIKKRFKDTTVYLDSNIFMDFQYENIFKYMIENKVKVTILKSQYDEILNLRKKFKNDKSDKAKILRPQLTLALNRIEKLLDKTKSNIKDIGFNSNKNAYADIDFIKAILKKLKKDKAVLFVTQDRDLRTRLKTMIKDDKKISQKNINIFKAEEFIEYVNAIEILTNERVNKQSLIEQFNNLKNRKKEGQYIQTNNDSKKTIDYFNILKENNQNNEIGFLDIINAVSNAIKKSD